MNNKTKNYKIVIIGDAAVGKTMISNAILNVPFREEYQPSVGASIVNIQYTNDLTGDTFCISLWDTAGQEEYQSLAPIFYQDAQAAVIVYDVQKELTFQHIHFWHDLFLQHIQLTDNKFIIVGNKIDLRKDNQEDTSTFVSTEKGLECACSIEADFIETSAKTGENISTLVHKLIEYAKSIQASVTQPNIENKEDNSSCC